MFKLAGLTLAALTPTEHLQGKSAAKTPDATANDKAKKGA